MSSGAIVRAIVSIPGFMTTTPRPNGRGKCPLPNTHWAAQANRTIARDMAIRCPQTQLCSTRLTSQLVVDWPADRARQAGQGNLDQADDRDGSCNVAWRSASNES